MRIWLFAILLVLWGNLLHPLIGSSAVLPGGSWQFVLAGAALIGSSLLAARWLGLDPEGLGLRRAGAFRGAVIGAFAAGAIALVVVVVLRLAPSITRQPSLSAPISPASAPEPPRPPTIYPPIGS